MRLCLFAGRVLSEFRVRGVWKRKKKGGVFKTGKTQCSLASSRDSGCREGEKEKKENNRKQRERRQKEKGYSFLFINLQENLWIGLCKIKRKPGGRGVHKEKDEKDRWTKKGS